MRRPINHRLLVDVVVEPCGDVLLMWSEEFNDGTWELHFRAGCDSCRRLVGQIAAREAPGARIRYEH